MYEGNLYGTMRPAAQTTGTIPIPVGQRPSICRGRSPIISSAGPSTRPSRIGSALIL